MEEAQRSERCCLYCHLGLERLRGEVQIVAAVRTLAGFQMSAAAAAAEWEEGSSFVAAHHLGEEDSAAALQLVNICSCFTTR